MGIGVSIGPVFRYTDAQAQSPGTIDGQYMVVMRLDVNYVTGPGANNLVPCGVAMMDLTAPSRHQWVEGLLNELLTYDSHAMTTERQKMLHVGVCALPSHLKRLLIRQAMRRQSALRQKLRRNGQREEAILWKKPRGTPTDWDAFHEARGSGARTRQALAIIQDLMRDLGRYLPAPLSPPPRPPPRSCVDLKPPKPRGAGGIWGTHSTTPPDLSGVVDRRDLIRPKPPPPRE